MAARRRVGISLKKPWKREMEDWATRVTFVIMQPIDYDTSSSAYDETFQP